MLMSPQFQHGRSKRLIFRPLKKKKSWIFKVFYMLQLWNVPQYDKNKVGLIPELIQRWKVSKGSNPNFSKIWLCNVPGIEAIIEIFQKGWIPRGFSETGCCIQMRTDMLLHRHLLTIHTATHAASFFFSSSQTLHRGLGGISWVEYFRRAVLFWRPAVRTLQSFYFKENALLFYSFIFPLDSFPPIHLRGFCKLFLSVAAAYVAGKKTKKQNRWLYRLRKKNT